MSHSCRFCRAPLSHTFCDLGNSPLANAYLSAQQLKEQEPIYPLHVYVCASCLLVQLPSLATPKELFCEYAYFSSYSSSWLKHCQEYATLATNRLKLNATSQVIEIASNDGYLLHYFKEKGMAVLGIEPAKNVAKAALEKGIPTLTHFFGRAFAESLEEKADLLIGNNVLAHVPDLNDFVAAMKLVLKEGGVITLEFPHLLNLIEEGQFDTIYHEHFSYFSILTLLNIFTHHGLTIFDVERLSTHGGSLRIWAQHREQNSHPLSPSVATLVALEKEHRLDCLSTYLSFGQKVEEVKKELLAFFTQCQREQKQVVAYGAPAKGNTLLNYCGVSSKSLLFTVDRNPYKQGKYLPGTHIPIFAPEKIGSTKPDYLLILPWNLKHEIMNETDYIRQWGGKFVIPIPKLEVIS